MVNLMRLFILLMVTVFLINCGNSNQVGNSKVKQANNKVAANNDSGLYCKKSKKTGSRMNTRTCITKEQRKKERRESANFVRDATVQQKNIVPGAVNN